MISDNIAITAAHCACNTTDRTLYPGYSKGNAPFGGARINQVIIHPNYDPNVWGNEKRIYKEDIHDWAILILDRNIGNNTGWLGTRTYNGNNLGFVSYPVDKNYYGYPVQMYSPRKSDWMGFI